MQKFTLPFLTKSLLSLWFVVLLYLPAFGQGFTAETEARLQEVLDSYLTNPDQAFVGGISASIKIDDVDKWAGASGYAARNVNEQNELLPGGTPFTTSTSTSSRVYSITKTFTAALILQLAEEKKLNLNDPISKYLPISYVNPQLNSAVTIEQLLAHESGYSDYASDYNFQIALAFQPDRIWSPLEVIYFVHQIAEPGTEHRYSSTNYILLGAIAEVVSGQPVAQLFRDRFLTPLTLNSTYLAVFEPAAQNGKTLEASPHDNLSPFNPIFYMLGRPTFPDAYTNVYRFDFTGIASAAFTAGGLVSTADDMVEWGSALYGGRATSNKVLQQILRSIAETPDEDDDYLGYGIFRNDKISETETFIGHPGEGPGYRSLLYHQPDKNITIAVLTNFAGADAYAIARDLYAVIAELYEGDKVKLCFKGKSMLVNHHATKALVAKGATLGHCGTAGKAGSAPAARQGMESLSLQLSTYPNPAASQVTLTFSVPADGPVGLQVISLEGKVVATLYKGEARAGEQKTLVWIPLQTLPEGLYIGRLITTGGVVNQRILLTR
jgi:CubicO group peptidase (beta-lactamase class C family)